MPSPSEILASLESKGIVRDAADGRWWKNIPLDHIAYDGDQWSHDGKEWWLEDAGGRKVDTSFHRRPIPRPDAELLEGMALKPGHGSVQFWRHPVTGIDTPLKSTATRWLDEVWPKAPCLMRALEETVLKDPVLAAEVEREVQAATQPPAEVEGEFPGNSMLSLEDWREQTWKLQEAYSELESERNDLRQQLATLTGERDGLAKRLENQIEWGVSTANRAEAAEGEVERLRAELEEARNPKPSKRLTLQFMGHVGCGNCQGTFSETEHQWGDKCPTCNPPTTGGTQG